MDNCYKECPAKMADARFLTDYRLASTREQYNKMINGYGFLGENEYRMFLQQNAVNIMDREWDYMYGPSCKPTCCVHTNNTRTTSGDNFKELETYDAVQQNKLKPSEKGYPACARMDPYRLTYSQK